MPLIIKDYQAYKQMSYSETPAQYALACYVLTNTTWDEAIAIGLWHHANDDSVTDALRAAYADQLASPAALSAAMRRVRVIYTCNENDDGDRNAYGYPLLKCFGDARLNT